MTTNEFFLQEYKNGRFTINFETGEIYSPKYKRNLGCVHKKTGYIIITLYDNNKNRYQISGHRLIWLCKHGEIDSNLQINHINGIKIDNRLCNLELVTCQENIKHAFKIGLMSGEKHSKILKKYYETHPSPNRKLTIETVTKIRELYKTGLYSYRSLGRMFSVDKVTIKKIILEIHYKF